jgi:hypothetical protein
MFMFVCLSQFLAIGAWVVVVDLFIHLRYDKVLELFYETVLHCEFLGD